MCEELCLPWIHQNPLSSARIYISFPPRSLFCLPLDMLLHNFLSTRNRKLIFHGFSSAFANLINIQNSTPLGHVELYPKGDKDPRMCRDLKYSLWPRAAVGFGYRKGYRLPEWLSLLCSKPYHIYAKVSRLYWWLLLPFFNSPPNTYGFFLLSKMTTAPIYVFLLLSKVLYLYSIVSPVPELSQQISKMQGIVPDVVRLPKGLLHDMAQHVAL